MIRIAAENDDSDYITREEAAEADRVVVKAGTNSLTDEHSNLDRGKLDKLVDDINDLHSHGKEVILVTSGAIGAGTGRIPVDNSKVENLQAASTVGQGRLMRSYSESFERYDRDVAQILVTHDDLEDERRFTNFRNTVETLLEWDVVPIVNENDAVAIEEIKVGDNDIISASIAEGVDAELLVTLTDVGGVYTANPKYEPDAELIEEAYDSFDEIWSYVGGEAAEFGGIKTKVEGAERVTEAGIPAVIAGSKEEDVLLRVAEGESVGSYFAAQRRDYESRKGEEELETDEDEVTEG